MKNSTPTTPDSWIKSPSSIVPNASKAPKAMPSPQEMLERQPMIRPVR